MRNTTLLRILPIVILGPVVGCRAQTLPDTTESGVQRSAESDTSGLDARVRSFLEENRRSWRDMNVPAADGETLYDMVLENGYTRALEIGTSTGRSAIYIAWALSKTGGKLITIDIDEGRLERAKANFEETGLSDYIDARLADAHELVKELEGPFDFVFVDADKEWYPQYFRDIYPKLADGGCYTAHNVTMRRGHMREFLQLLEDTPGMETEIVHASRSGLSVSYKRSPAEE